MATTDDLMEFSAEARTPMGDDIDIEFGDGDENLDQDMFEDGMDNLVDDEMEDEDASLPIDTDVILDTPHLEVDDVKEINMGSRAPSDIASPMAQGGTPVPEPSLAAVVEVAEDPSDQNAVARYPEITENPDDHTALPADQISTRDFADEAFEHANNEITEEAQKEGPSDAEQALENSTKEEEKDEITAEAVVSEQNQDDSESVPQLEEPAETHTKENTDNADNTQEEPEALEESSIHSIVVDYSGTKMSLFPPSTEHEGSESFLLEDEALCHEPLSHLLADCRRVLKDDVLDGEEMVLHIPCLSVSIAESVAEQMPTTMSDLVDLFISLSYNDGIDRPEALSIMLEVKPKVHSRLEYIRSVIAEGKGLLHIYSAANPHESNSAQTTGDGNHDDAIEAPLGYDFGEDAGENLHDFDEHFEAHTPLIAGEAGQDDLLDFTTPLKDAQDLRATAAERGADDLEEPLVPNAQNEGEEYNEDGEELVGDELVNMPEGLDEAELQTSTEYADADYQIQEDKAEADDSHRTNNSELANEPTDEQPQMESAEVIGTFSVPEEEDEPALEDPETTAAATNEITHLPEEELDEGLAEVSASHTEQSSSNTERGDEIEQPADFHDPNGDDIARGSPSSLKRRRPSSDEAVDLLDDAQTPSPQAKRTRPS